MSRKAGSLKGLVVKKGEATSENRYIGEDGKAAPPDAAAPPAQIDGRTLRRTGRTQKFAATVKPEWAIEIKTIAAEEGKLIVEVLEEALEAYKKKGKR